MECKIKFAKYPHLLPLRGSRQTVQLSETYNDIATGRRFSPNKTVSVFRTYNGRTVGIASQNAAVYAIDERGEIIGDTAPYDAQNFAFYVSQNAPHFATLIDEGATLWGEWLEIAFGTVYLIAQPVPFVATDYVTTNENGKRNRTSQRDMRIKFGDTFQLPQTLFCGERGVNRKKIYFELCNTIDHRFHAEQDGGYVIEVCDGERYEFSARCTLPKFDKKKYLKIGLKNILL